MEAHLSEDFRITDDRLVVSKDELDADRRGERIVEISTSRPTLTRTAGGLLVGGPIGALLGFAWRKRDRQKIRLPK